MSESDKPISEATAPEASVGSATTNPHPTDAPATPAQQAVSRREARRWWLRLVVQPLLFLFCGVALFAGLGVAQRLGWISAGSGGGAHVHVSPGDGDVQYICPMMCTPPQGQEGRCPVCGMELVPSTSGAGATDSRSIHVDPATRRVANIQTAAVRSMPVQRTIRAIGELSYDEGTLRTISAYVDGRLDRLYADYTGIVVNEGDHLALLYSPQLYSGQVELLLAKKARERSAATGRSQVAQPDLNLYESAKERLTLLGMTEMQFEHLEQAGKANSRMHLCAPISGTVIEKLAVEGQYVKEGDPIYKLADLSTVWLMLRLFPEDAALIRYGQQVEAEIHSLPGRLFTGRVAFIDPNVDPETRAVGVRVVISNQDGLLRVGDYAKATIAVPLGGADKAAVYDPELAGKWISPRHPHIVSAAAGKCTVCGVDLIPAAELGFTNQPIAGTEALVVPRDAVLMAGNSSVVYVETEPGRFEIRRVVLGPVTGDQLVIRSGVADGEQIATRGNFLIDSQMQLAGNPSLIDPMKAEPKWDESTEETMLAALSQLSPADRDLVDKQRICPVADQPLGSMGVPKKIDVQGRVVFICCEGCRDELLAKPEKYLVKLDAKTEDASTHDERTPAGDSLMDLPPIGVPQLFAPEDSPASDDAPPHGHHERAPTARHEDSSRGVVR